MLSHSHCQDMQRKWGTTSKCERWYKQAIFCFRCVSRHQPPKNITLENHSCPHTNMCAVEKTNYLLKQFSLKMITWTCILAHAPIDINVYLYTIRFYILCYEPYFLIWNVLEMRHKARCTRDSPSRLFQENYIWIWDFIWAYWWYVLYIYIWFKCRLTLPILLQLYFKSITFYANINHCDKLMTTTGSDDFGKFCNKVSQKPINFYASANYCDKLIGGTKSDIYNFGTVLSLLAHWIDCLVQGEHFHRFKCFYIQSPL